MKRAYLVCAWANESVVAEVPANVGRDDFAVDAVARHKVLVLARRCRRRLGGRRWRPVLLPLHFRRTAWSTRGGQRRGRGREGIPRPKVKSRRTAMRDVELATGTGTMGPLMRESGRAEGRWNEGSGGGRGWVVVEEMGGVQAQGAPSAWGWAGRCGASWACRACIVAVAATAVVWPGRFLPPLGRVGWTGRKRRRPVGRPFRALPAPSSRRMAGAGRRPPAGGRGGDVQCLAWRGRREGVHFQ